MDEAVTPGGRHLAKYDGACRRRCQYVRMFEESSVWCEATVVKGKIVGHTDCRGVSNLVKKLIFTGATRRGGQRRSNNIVTLRAVHCHGTRPQLHRTGKHRHRLHGL